MKQQKHRDALRSAKRIVVKAGSKVLVERSGCPDAERLALLTGEMAQFRRAGGELAFVSSGAVGAGMEALGMTTRPKAMPDLQMAAAVGQMRLMSVYDQLFAQQDCQIGQVLLTYDALKHRERHLNARNTLLNLIAHGIIPVINENDAISTEEIKFGDNDVLAALVAILIDADALILLSTTDGLRDSGRRRSYLEEVDAEVLGLVSDKPNALSTGGMASKLQSAQLAAQNGIPVVIADGRKSSVLERILQGEDEGTLLFPKAGTISIRKRWIAFFNRAEGYLTIDDGAVAALQKGKSLLPVGIKRIDGTFKVGAMVNIQTLTGKRIARGLVEYSSTQMAELLTTQGAGEAIHRDNMVVL
jgi:glutamate 5-kinase